MRFLRHDEIYRSDGSFVSLGRGAPSRWSVPGQADRHDGRPMPCPSFSMSSVRLFLDRDGRHQSPSPLHRLFQLILLVLSNASIYHRTVDDLLTGCVSPGDKRIHMNHLGTLVKRELRLPGSSGGNRTRSEAGHARTIDLAERARRRAWILFNELLEHGAVKPEGYQEPKQSNTATSEPE